MGTDDAAPHIVLTLVHGTWARGAAWTRPESPFRIMIQDELRGLGAASVTVISDFEWSGLNRHEDRREAALALQCKLKTVLAGRPNAFHFLIGHSHRFQSRNNKILSAFISNIADATHRFTFNCRPGILVNW